MLREALQGKKMAWLWTAAALLAAGGVWHAAGTLSRSKVALFAFVFLGVASLLPWLGRLPTVRKWWLRGVSPLWASARWPRVWLAVGLGMLWLALWPPERLRPPWVARQRILIWFWGWWAWASGVLALQGPAGKKVARRLKAYWTERMAAGEKAPWLGLTLGLWAAAGLIGATGWGLRAPWTLNWQGFATPVLPQHLLGVGVGLWALWWVTSRWRRPWPKALETGSLILLWVLTWAAWWLTTPAPNYFLSPAYPPTHERFPSSDALVHDLVAWQAQLGYGYDARTYAKFEGLARGNPFWGRPGLVGLLAELQSIASHWPFSPYPTYWLLFVGLLSLTVPLAYLLGARAHSRALGVALAALILWREMGAMTAAHRLAGVHVKNLMSEPLLRWLLMGLVGVALAPSGRQGGRKGFLFGVVLGWAVLVRAESLVLLPLLAWPALEGWRARWPWRRVLGAVWAAAFGLGLVWAPWMLRTALLSQNWPETSGYHATPWFFLMKIKAGASPEYRLPPTPTPSPEGMGRQGQGALLAPRAPQQVREQAWKAAGLTGLEPEGLLEDGAGGPGWVARVREWPLVGVFFRWPREVWLQWGHYVGRNVVTSWSAFPWTPRWYDPVQYAHRRPLAEGRPLGAGHKVMLGVNLALVALGWLAVWRRHRRAALFPWGVYGLYLVGLAFGRVGGGRYIVPIDWIPLVYYAMGWVVVLREGAQGLGLRVPAGWWQRPVSLTARPWGAQGFALVGAVLISASWLGVGLEARAVQRADAGPWAGPPRRQWLTAEDLLAQLDAWQVWSHTALDRAWVAEQVRQRPWMPLWGYVFYPRYVTGGEHCGDWCGYITPAEDTLFFAALDARGRHLLALSPAVAPRPWEVAREALVLACPQPHSEAFPLHRRAVLLVLRQEEGVRVYAAPAERWECP